MTEENVPDLPEEEEDGEALDAEEIEPIEEEVVLDPEDFPDDPRLKIDQPEELLFPICYRCGQQHCIYRWTPHARSQEGTFRWIKTCKGHRRIYEDPDTKEGYVGLAACRRFPLKGLEVCSYHGGFGQGMQERGRQKVLQESRQRRLEQRIGLVLTEIDPKYRDQHPLEGLLDEIARSAQLVDWLARQVAKLHYDDPTAGELADLRGFDEDGREVVAQNRFKLIGVNNQGDLATHPLWDRLDKERMNHAKLCALALQANVNERALNLAAAQATQVATVIGAVLKQLKLDDDTVQMARAMIGSMLRSGAIEVQSQVHPGLAHLQNKYPE